MQVSLNRLIFSKKGLLEGEGKKSCLTHLLIFFLGAKMHNKDQKFYEIMNRAAKLLNLKPHKCGLYEEDAVVLPSAADIEGHLGTDGKYYLLDFSRTMPPSKPDRRHKNGHLYHLFRREFLLSFCHGSSLCPDAYSGFVILDERRREYSKENDEATHSLLNEVIPRCVSELDKVWAKRGLDLINFFL